MIITPTLGEGVQLWGLGEPLWISVPLAEGTCCLANLEPPAPPAAALAAALRTRRPLCSCAA